jgi:GNAT superfamily N-acetyltransferase
VSDYRIRPATLADLDLLIHHRIAMFRDMGVTLDAEALTKAFTAWLQQLMPAGTYRAWLVETADGRAVAGGGMTVIPWPPGPRSMHDRLAFVYNVYTEPGHRRRGLGRLVMETIHTFCREAGIAFVALNASQDGLPMYEAMGYGISPSPMMFFPVVGYNPSA